MHSRFNDTCTAGPRPVDGPEPALARSYRRCPPPPLECPPPPPLERPPPPPLKWLLPPPPPDRGAEKLRLGAEKLRLGAEKFRLGAEKLRLGAEKLRLGAEKLCRGAKKFWRGAEFAGANDRLLPPLKLRPPLK